jgi:hypothetical protein
VAGVLSMVMQVSCSVQCTKFHTAGWACWFFTSFYLESYIWPDAISLRLQQRNSECASVSAQILEKVQWRPWQWWDKHLGKKAWALHGKSKLTETKKDETGEEQSQEHDHHKTETVEEQSKEKGWHQWYHSQRICLSRPNRQFRILQWRFKATAWKCAETSPRTLVTKELDVAAQKRSVSHFLFHKRVLNQKQNNITAVPHPSYFSAFLIEDKTVKPSFWHNWGDQGRIAGGAGHAHRTWLPRCI